MIPMVNSMSAPWIGFQTVNDDLVFRLRERARIRRQIPTRKSVQEGAPDRIADLLEEAATEIETLRQNQWRKLTPAEEKFQQSFPDPDPMGGLIKHFRED